MGLHRLHTIWGPFLVIILILFIFSVVVALFNLIVLNSQVSFKSGLEILLKSLIPLNIGVAAFIRFVGHAFFGKKVAELIGWAESPFQLEVAMVHLTFGILGLLCLKLRKGFWLATALGNAIFLLCAGYIHLFLIRKGLEAHENAGFFLVFSDMVVPLLILALTLVYFYQSHVRED